MIKFFEQIFKKGQQTESAPDKPRAELTEEEIQKKLSNLGDIMKLAEKVEPPFNHLSIEALARLVIKLERDLPTYDTILSDDVSGRLPSLLLRKIIDKVRSKNNLGPVKTYFLAAGRYAKSEKRESIKKFLTDKRNAIGKALLVTEYIQSGEGIAWVMNSLQEAEINFDVASVSSSLENEFYIKEFGDIFKKLRYGQRGDAGLSFYGMTARRVGGVAKDPSNPSPHPEALGGTMGEASRAYQKRAREDANFLAAEFIDKLLD